MSTVVTSGHVGKETVMQTLPLLCFGDLSVSNRAHRLCRSNKVKHQSKQQLLMCFHCVFIVSRCMFDYPSIPVSSFTCAAAVLAELIQCPHCWHDGKYESLSNTSLTGKGSILK